MRAATTFRTLMAESVLVVAASDLLREHAEAEAAAAAFASDEFQAVAPELLISLPESPVAAASPSPVPVFDDHSHLLAVPAAGAGDDYSSSRSNSDFDEFQQSQHEVGRRSPYHDLDCGSPPLRKIVGNAPRIPVVAQVKGLLKHSSGPLRLTGYNPDYAKMFLYYMCCVMTAGVFAIVCSWFPNHRFVMKYSKAPLSKASWVLVQRKGLAASRVPQYAPIYGYETFQLIIYEHLRYICLSGADYSSSGFRRPVFDIHKSYSQLYNQFGQPVAGFSPEQAAEVRRSVHGQNAMAVPMPGNFNLLVSEILHPFYFFQLLSSVVWSLEGYYYYAGVIVLTSTVSAIVDFRETKRNLTKLRDMAWMDEPVTVARPAQSANGLGLHQGDADRMHFKPNQSSLSLVPGDIIELEPGMVLPCDAVLLSGRVLVQESMLTGESCPVSKTSLTAMKGDDQFYCPPVHSDEDDSSDEDNSDNEDDSQDGDSPRLLRPSAAAARLLLDSNTMLQDSPSPKATSAAASASGTGDQSGENKNLTLYCGTTILHCTPGARDEPPTAVVIRTGFNTAKGAMVRSILCPESVDLSFYKESFRFIGALFLLALSGFVYTIITYLVTHENAAEIDWYRVVLYGLDLITVTVPPALPLALTISTVLAVRRLKHNKDSQIMTISPTRVNVAAKVNLMCFDKTGTLTEDGLDVQGYLIARDGEFVAELPGSNVSQAQTDSLVGTMDNVGDMTWVLCGCHSLTLLPDLEVAGDSLELKMVEAAGWKLQPLLPKARISVRGVQVPPISRLTGPNNQECFVIRAFDFSSQDQRMTAVMQDVDDALKVVVKGSPSVIQQLVEPESLPEDWEARLQAYTQRGYRVLACAVGDVDKILQSQNLQLKDEDFLNWGRSVWESELEFAGFLIMENRIRPDTEPTIRQLHEVGIRTVMVTGDNQLTALHVAQQAGIVSINAPRIQFDAGRDGLLAVAVHDPETGMLEDLGLGPQQQEAQAQGAHITALVATLSPEALRAQQELAAQQLMGSPRRPHHRRTRDHLDAPCAGSTTTAPGAAGIPGKDGKEEKLLSSAEILAQEMRRAAVQGFAGPAPEVLRNMLKWTTVKQPPPEEHQGQLPVLPSPGVALQSYQRDAFDGPIKGVECDFRAVFGGCPCGSCCRNGTGAAHSSHTLVVTGKVFQWLLDHKEYQALGWLVVRTQIFARMLPGQKQALMQVLTALGLTVGMCGDGANDCGALKTAAIGLSLSNEQAETSIAAPFSTPIASIRPVLALLLEGRSSLVTSFQTFQFMALYSTIQSISVIILVAPSLILSDWQFLSLDMFLVLPITLAMVRRRPAKSLSLGWPNTRLISVRVIGGVILHTAVCAVGQLSMYFYMKQQDWFDPAGEHIKRSQQATVVWWASVWQYMIVALVFAAYTGSKFQVSLWKDRWILVVLGVLASFFGMCLAVHPSWFEDLMQFRYMSNAMMVLIVMGALAHLVAAVFIQSWVLPRLKDWNERRRLSSGQLLAPYVTLLGEQDQHLLQNLPSTDLAPCKAAMRDKDSLCHCHSLAESLERFPLLEDEISNGVHPWRLLALQHTPPTALGLQARPVSCCPSCAGAKASLDDGDHRLRVADFQVEVKAAD